MPSAESTRAASRERRDRATANLVDARRGAGRNRNRADRQVPPSHGDPPRSATTPGTYPGGRS